VKRLTRWKLTSPWLRVPPGASRVRMIFSGRWHLQVPKGADYDPGVQGAPTDGSAEEPEGGEDAE
jgi:hypothetical protein